MQSLLGSFAIICCRRDDSKSLRAANILHTVRSGIYAIMKQKSRCCSAKRYASPKLQSNVDTKNYDVEQSACFVVRHAAGLDGYLLPLFLTVRKLSLLHFVILHNVNSIVGIIIRRHHRNLTLHPFGLLFSSLSAFLRLRQGLS